MTKAAQRARERRQRVRAAGLRGVEVHEEIAREVRELRYHPSEHEIERFLDAALADVEGWE